MPTDNKENFDNLDELFRSAFEKLPATANSNGWDSPSEQVWQQVQRNIKPPKNGWSGLSMGVFVAFCVTVALGLYLAFGYPKPSVATQEKTDVPSSVLPTLKPETDTPPMRSDTDVMEKLPENNAPVSKPPVAPKNAAPSYRPHNKPATQEQQAEEKSNAKNTRTLPETATPLPGTKPPVAPNTTEAKKERTEGNSNKY